MLMFVQPAARRLQSKSRVLVREGLEECSRFSFFDSFAIIGLENQTEAEAIVGKAFCGFECIDRFRATKNCVTILTSFGGRRLTFELDKVSIDESFFWELGSVSPLEGESLLSK